MKKKSYKGLAWLGAMLLVICCFCPFPAIAAEMPTVTLSVETRSVDGADLLSAIEVPFTAGESVFTISTRAWDAADLLYDASAGAWGAFVNSIGGIGNDPLSYHAYSGWSYCVNGSFASVAADAYQPQDGDKIRWIFSVTSGSDPETGIWDPYIELHFADGLYQLAQLLQQGQEAEEASFNGNWQHLQEVLIAAQAYYDSILAYEGSDENKFSIFGYLQEQDITADGLPYSLLQTHIGRLQKALGLANNYIPAQSVVLPQTEMTFVIGQSAPLLPQTKPAEATLKQFTYQVQDGTDILSVTENGLVTALAVGQAHVAVFHEEAADPAVCQITVLPAAQERDAAQAIASLSDWILRENEQNVLLPYIPGNSDWNYLALKRAGQNVAPGYGQAVASYLAQKNGQLPYATDYARYYLCLKAGNYDVQSVGYDLLALLLAKEDLPYQGLNSIAYALIALGASDEAMPSSSAWTVEELLTELKKYQNSRDGGFSLFQNGASDVDATAVALQAMAPYWDDARYQLTGTVAQAVTWLADQQMADGGYYSPYSGVNSESISQVVLSLCSLDMIPDGPAFDQEHGNLLTALAAFFQPDGGLSHQIGEDSNGFASQQALLAYSAQLRKQNGQNGVYHFSDAQSDFSYLEKAITAANPYLSQQEQFTVKSFAALQDAFATAQSLTNSAKQNEIDDAYFALQEAVAGLKKPIAADATGNITVNAEGSFAFLAQSGQNYTANIKKGLLYADIAASKGDLPQIKVNYSNVTLRIPAGNGYTGAEEELLLWQVQTDPQKQYANALQEKLQMQNQKLDSLLGIYRVGQANGSFSNYNTITLKNKSDAFVAVQIDGNMQLVPKMASVAAGQNSGQDIFFCVQNSDIVIYSKSCADFVFYTIKSDGGSTGGGGEIISKTVYLTIDCSTVDKGLLLDAKEVSWQKGDTPVSVLQRAFPGNIVIQGSGSSAYVVSIGGMSERDYGAGSGWLYQVNGKFYSKGAGTYALQAGDEVVWLYTTNLGEDVGATQSGASGNTDLAFTGDWYDAWQNALHYAKEQKNLSYWGVFALAINGMLADTSYYEEMGANIKEQNGRFRKVTDLAAMALAINAMGKDAAQVGEYNLIKAIEQHEQMTMQGVNGPAFALLAYDSKAYAIPADSDWNRETIIAYLLEQQRADGCFPLTDTERDNVDLTAMVLQALTPYRQQEKVQKAIDLALQYLEKNQQADGSFQLYGVSNAESCAQVLIALSGLGIDVQQDTRFIKN